MPVSGTFRNPILAPITGADGQLYYLFNVALSVLQPSGSYAAVALAPTDVSLSIAFFGTGSGAVTVAAANNYAYAADPNTILVAVPAGLVPSNTTLQIQATVDGNTGAYNPAKTAAEPSVAALLNAVPAPLVCSGPSAGLLAWSVGVRIVPQTNGTAYTVDVLPMSPFVEASTLRTRDGAFALTYDGATDTVGPIFANPVGVIATTDVTRFSLAGRGTYGAPVASFLMCKTAVPCAASLTQAVTAQNITLDGTFSESPVGEALTYRWSFGDGGSSTAAVAKHDWKHGGLFEVTLTVTDTEGRSGSASAPLTILASPPTGVLLVSPNPTTRAQQTDFVAQILDPAATWESYSWLLDGTTPTWSTNSSRLVSPWLSGYALGSHTMSVFVSDSNHATSEFDATFTIVNVPPIAHATVSGTLFRTGTPIAFQDMSRDIDGSLVSDVWTWGDGTSTTGTTAFGTLLHSFAADGKYAPSLAVTDNDGATTGAVLPTIVSEGVPPSVSYTLPPSHNGWYNRSPVIATASIQDEFDPAPVLSATVDGKPASRTGMGISVPNDGIHLLSVKGTNWVQLSSWQNGTVQIDTTAPSVSISSPLLARGYTTFSVSGTDTGSGIAGVAILMDGKVIGSQSGSGPYTLVWDSRGTTNGEHVVTGQATDNAGNVATTSQQIILVINV
jgi:hypothetical protein